MAGLLLSVLFGATAAAGVAAAPGPARLAAGMTAPIHAFDWPDSAPNDPYFSSQTDLPPIGLASAWLRTTGSPSVIVAVLDTGLDASHPEFAGRAIPGFNALTGRADTAADFAPTNDSEGHGTHVSGTIAAAANNGVGIAGIAPGISIMPVKVLDATGEGDFDGLVKGMTWAVGHGARIVTMSLGGTLDSATAASVQGTFDAAYSAGVVVVAAAGNDGATVDQYPCNFSHVICVGSATNDGSAVSTFSTRTAALTLVAPGENITSTFPGNGYASGSGTSMATPHVTGAVALMRSLDPALSVDQILADLSQTARPLAAGGRNPDSGFGLLQVSAALDLVAGGTPVPTPTPIPGASPTPTPIPGASPTPTPSPSPGASPTPDPTASPTPTPVAAPTLLRPTVTATTPRNGSRNIARATRPHLTFSVAVRGISSRTITMLDLSRGRAVNIRISYSASSQIATIIPSTRLAANHSYRILISGVTSASGGLPLSRTFAVTFRTGLR